MAVGGWNDDGLLNRRRMWVACFCRGSRRSTAPFRSYWRVSFWVCFRSGRDEFFSGKGRDCLFPTHSLHLNFGACSGASLWSELACIVLGRSPSNCAGAPSICGGHHCENALRRWDGKSFAPGLGQMIRLRGHHLLCLLTYIGKGYNPEFVANLDRIVARLHAGESIQIVSGPDDVCKMGEVCADPFDAHCLTNEISQRDRHAFKTLSDVLPLTIGDFLHASDFPQWTTQLRLAFSKKGEYFPSCQGCEWQPLCLDIAKNGFAGAKLFPK